MDREFEYHGFEPSVRSRCRLRIDATLAGFVVTASELSDNPGISISDAVEPLATAVWDGLGRPYRMQWVEHYPAAHGIGDGFALVRFDDANEESGLRSPQYTYLDPEVIPSFLVFGVL
jgi:hypothetical protein